MENIFCLESHIHLCSRHTNAIPAYVIKTCVTWHAISGTRYWGFVSPKLHVSTYRNQQHCWWFHKCAWWRHQMKTYSALLTICAGNSPVTGEFPAQRPVTRSFDVFFDLHLIKPWVNNRKAGDLRCHRTHNDVIVMVWKCYESFTQFCRPNLPSVTMFDTVTKLISLKDFMS